MGGQSLVKEKLGPNDDRVGGKGTSSGQWVENRKGGIFS